MDDVQPDRAESAARHYTVFDSATYGGRFDSGGTNARGGAIPARRDGKHGLGYRGDIGERHWSAVTRPRKISRDEADESAAPASTVAAASPAAQVSDSNRGPRKLDPVSSGFDRRG